MPEDARLQGFESLISYPQSELEKQAQLADEARSDETRNHFLKKVAGEVSLIATLCRSYTNAGTLSDGIMESGCPSSPDRRQLVAPSAMTVVRRSWPKIAQLASTHAQNEVRLVTTELAFIPSTLTSFAFPYTEHV